MDNYPDGFDQSQLDGQEENTYIVEISGFVEISAYDRDDAKEQARA